MNSIYGFIGVSYGLLLCKLIVESVIVIGRELIKKIMGMVEEVFGVIVVYGDIDFVYVIFLCRKEEYGIDIEYMEYLFVLVNKCIDYIIFNMKYLVKILFEKFMRLLMLYKKKYYVYKLWERLDKDLGIYYKGLKIVRRDICKYVRDLLDKWYRIMLDEYKNKKMIINELRLIVI